MTHGGTNFSFELQVLRFTLQLFAIIVPVCYPLLLRDYKYMQTSLILLKSEVLYFIWASFPILQLSVLNAEGFVLTHGGTDA